MENKRDTARNPWILKEDPAAGSPDPQQGGLVRDSKLDTLP